MEDKILEKLTNKLKEELEKIATTKLENSNNVLEKAKKTSTDLINNMNEAYIKRLEELKAESQKVNSLEERVVQLEESLVEYKTKIEQIELITKNPKLKKKYLK